MKYIGFEIPDFNFNGVDWLYDLIEDRGGNKAYVITANSPEQARKKLFDEIYEEFDEPEVVAYFFIKELSESYDEDEIIPAYGEKDGLIISKILDDLYDLSQEEKDKLPFYDKRVDDISSQGIKKLVFEKMECSLGIIKVEKELK